MTLPEFAIQGRDHIDRRHGEGKTDLTGVDLGQEHRQRLCIRIGEQDEGLLDHVPIVDEDQDGNRIERRPAFRQADFCKDLPFPRAVHLGRLDQGKGNAAHELRQQEDRKGGEHARENDAPAGVQDAQPAADQIVRHQRHLIGHQHQDDVEKEDAAAQFAAPARKAVGRHRGDRHLQDHDGHHQQDAVPQLQQVFRRFYKPRDVLGQGDLVGNELQVDRLRDVAALGGREDHAVVCLDLGLGHEPSTSFPNQSSALKRMAIRITITMAMTTAAEESF